MKSNLLLQSIELKWSTKHKILQASLSEFCEIQTNSESAGNRIRYLEVRTQCIQRIVRHSYRYPINNSEMTSKAV